MTGFQTSRRILTILLIGIGLFLVAFVAVTSWKIPPGIEADFKIKDWSGMVHGTFDFKDSKITFDPKAPENAQMDVSLEVASIKTGIGMRDKHLRSDDFFAAESYPLMKFHSTKVSRAEKGGYLVVGDLTIKDVTKSVTIPFNFNTLPNGNGLFEGEFKLDRVEYHVGESRKSMGDIVNISLKVPVAPEK